MTRLALALLVLAALAPAQEKPDPDEVISVPRRYVSSEGLAHQESGKISYLGIGKEIGAATREGLSAVVDQAERFGTTKVGTFVMVLIAWRLMARDVLHILLGIPIGLAGVWLWVWIARRLFFGYRVLARKEGNTKFYEEKKPYQFGDSEARAVMGFLLFVALIAWLVASLVVIFA